MLCHEWIIEKEVLEHDHPTLLREQWTLNKIKILFENSKPSYPRIPCPLNILVPKPI